MFDIDPQRIAALAIVNEGVRKGALRPVERRGVVTYEPIDTVRAFPTSTCTITEGTQLSCLYAPPGDQKTEVLRLTVVRFAFGTIDDGKKPRILLVALDDDKNELRHLSIRHMHQISIKE